MAVPVRAKYRGARGLRAQLLTIDAVVKSQELPPTAHNDSSLTLPRHAREHVYKGGSGA
jgi:hypothetical protein